MPLESNSFSAQKRLAGKQFRNGQLGDLLTDVYNDVDAGFTAAELAITAAVDAAVGDLTTLTTTDKASAVAAVNEVDAAVGDLTTLTTTDKTSTVAAINEVAVGAEAAETMPGIPSAGYLVLNDAFGMAQLPGAGDTFRVELGIGVTDPDATFTWVVGPPVLAGDVEIGVTAAACVASLVVAINTHLGLTADVLAAQDAVPEYCNLQVKAGAFREAGTALVLTPGGVTPGIAAVQQVAQPKGKYLRAMARYVVTLQDVFKGSIPFNFGHASLKGFKVSIETSITDSSPRAWDGASTIAGGRLTVDNTGGFMDWAAGNVVIADLWGSL